MRILVTGTSGQLGAYLLRQLKDENASAIAWSGSHASELFGFRLRPVDLADRDTVATAFRDAQPDIVIHAAAVASVAACYSNPSLAQQVNVAGSALLARLCSEIGARLLLVSTDLVFDGAMGYYREQDAPAPLSVYGRTKLEAERAVLAVPGNAVARVSLLYGPPLNGRYSFFSEIVAALRAGKSIRLFEDEWRTPLDLESAVRGLLGVARSDFCGLLHLGGPERMSRLEMGRRIATVLDLDARAIVPIRRVDAAAPEPRPRDTSLDSSLFRDTFCRQRLPTLADVLHPAGEN